MIKRSALPKGIITKWLGDVKLVMTFAGQPKMQKVVMMRDLRLPKFEKKQAHQTGSHPSWSSL